MLAFNAAVQISYMYTSLTCSRIDLFIGDILDSIARLLNNPTIQRLESFLQFPSIGSFSPLQFQFYTLVKKMLNIFLNEDDLFIGDIMDSFEISEDEFGLNLLQGYLTIHCFRD